MQAALTSPLKPGTIYRQKSKRAETTLSQEFLQLKIKTFSHFISKVIKGFAKEEVDSRLVLAQTKGEIRNQEAKVQDQDEEWPTSTSMSSERKEKNMSPPSYISAIRPKPFGVTTRGLLH